MHVYDLLGCGPEERVVLKQNGCGGRMKRGLFLCTISVLGVDKLCSLD